ADRYPGARPNLVMGVNVHPDEVLTSEALSQLYGTQVDVIRVRDRVTVVAVPDETAQEPHHPELPHGARP
ncbi:hypothetical protein ABZZ80_47695, partial [Streptomyces sp. NPDC006356]